MTGRSLETSTLDVIAITEPPRSAAADPFVNVDEAAGAERDRLLDEDTIRNAVTSADLGDETNGIPWANEATGSSGTITAVEQRKIAGQTCRSFKATREAYDGVSLYDGDICLDRRTGWWTRTLTPASVSKTG